MSTPTFTVTDNCPPPPSLRGTVFGQKSPITIAFEQMKVGQCINFGILEKKYLERMAAKAYFVAKNKGFQVCTRKVNGEFRVYRIA